jgi:hypothetical protein
MVRIVLILAVFVFVSIRSASAALVANWEFNGNLTQTVSGGPNFVSSAGVSYSPGVDGSSVTLTGSSSFLDLGTNTTTFLNTSSDYTVAFWMRASAARNQSLISFDDDGAWIFRTAIYTDATGIRAAYSNLNNQTAFVGANIAYLQTWTHVALTQDTNNGSGQTVLTLYLNGQQVSSGSVASNPGNFGIDTGEVGRYHAFFAPEDALLSPPTLTSNGSHYAGSFDRMSIWSHQLTAGEILTLAAVPEASSLWFGVAVSGLIVGSRLLTRRRRTVPTSA